MGREKTRQQSCGDVDQTGMAKSTLTEGAAHGGILVALLFRVAVLGVVGLAGDGQVGPHGSLRAV
jgi:hypothetical protein